MYRGRFSLFLSPKNPHQMRKQANIKMLNFACERNFIELENEKKEKIPPSRSVTSPSIIK
jgi:hypothetical protein